jgi:hypothetical protein
MHGGVLIIVLYSVCLVSILIIAPMMIDKAEDVTPSQEGDYFSGLSAARQRE